MAHSVSEQAARAVKNSERKKVVETRTPEEILKGIRGNLAAHLSVTPNDIQFLLDRYYAAAQAVVDSDVKRGTLGLENETLRADIKAMEVKLEEFRTVYEQENRSTTVTVERVQSYGDGIQENLIQTAAAELPESDHFVDHGGEA
jgi:hypothetical protein